MVQLLLRQLPIAARPIRSIGNGTKLELPPRASQKIKTYAVRRREPRATFKCIAFSSLPTPMIFEELSQAQKLGIMRSRIFAPRSRCEFPLEKFGADPLKSHWRRSVAFLSGLAYNNAATAKGGAMQLQERIVRKALRILRLIGPLSSEFVNLAELKSPSVVYPQARSIARKNGFSRHEAVLFARATHSLARVRQNCGSEVMNDLLRQTRK